MGFLGDIFGPDKTTSSIPKYLENSSKELLSKSKKLVANDKYTAYKGGLVAGPNSYYTKAADVMKGQRDVASANFGKAGSIIDNTKAGTTNYYGGMASALDQTNPLSENYFGKAQSVADSLQGDYFGDAGNAVNGMRALSGDYYGDAANSLRGIDRGGATYGEADDLINAGSNRFLSGMDSAGNKIAQAAARGGATNDAMQQYDSLGNIIGSAQDRAEGTQLGTNAGLRSTLGGAMGDSSNGYDEAAGLTRKASRLDSTNLRAIQDRMNPYTSEVTDNILRDYGKERGIAAKGLTDSARAAGAFGGSRHGVAQGMFDQETSKAVGDISTAQREKSFNNATSRLDADRGNLLSSAGQLSGMQQSRDAGTLGFTSQIGDLASRDANLIRQGGLDLAGATKDAASGKMAGERQLFDMDSSSAKMLQDLSRGYSDESQRTAKSKLDNQAQKFGQDMSYQDREAALASGRLAQQGQEFNQTGDIADRKSGLARDRLAQQNQQYTQQSDVGKSLLGQQGQKFGQEMDIVSARDALAKGELGQENQRFGQNMTLADMQKALGVEDQKSKQAYAADLLGYGKETNALEQKRLDSKKAQYDEKKNYEYEKLNWLSSIMSGQPYTKTSSTSTAPGNSIVGAITSGLGSFLSDENEKEGRSDADLEGILSSFRKMPVDDYDYKKGVIDAGMAPEGRRTGPMAQDWAKEFGGTGKDIDVAQMLGKLAGAVKGLEQRTAQPEPKRGLPRRAA